MASFTVTRQYDVPKERVWALFADIPNVADFTPNITQSKALNRKRSLGAQRHCDFRGGAGVHEEVTAWEDGRQIRFEATKIWGMPMKKMVATFDFSGDGDGSEVSCLFEYNMKMGWIMNRLAKPGMKKAMQGMLDGAAEKA